jgi:hypothetical protein
MSLILPNAVFKDLNLIRRAGPDFE